VRSGSESGNSDASKLGIDLKRPFYFKIITLKFGDVEVKIKVDIFIT